MKYGDALNRVLFIIGVSFGAVWLIIESFNSNEIKIVVERETVYEGPWRCVEINAGAFSTMLHIKEPPLCVRKVKTYVSPEISVMPKEEKKDKK